MRYAGFLYAHRLTRHRGAQAAILDCPDDKTTILVAPRYGVSGTFPQTVWRVSADRPAHTSRQLFHLSARLPRIVALCAHRRRIRRVTARRMRQNGPRTPRTPKACPARCSAAVNGNGGLGGQRSRTPHHCIAFPSVAALTRRSAGSARFWSCSASGARSGVSRRPFHATRSFSAANGRHCVNTAPRHSRHCANAQLTN